VFWKVALTPDPAPALRIALTPGPSPALRERGDLGRERGIGGRIATAALISPFLSPYGRGRGLGGR